MRALFLLVCSVRPGTLAKLTNKITTRFRITKTLTATSVTVPMGPTAHGVYIGAKPNRSCTYIDLPFFLVQQHILYHDPIVPSVCCINNKGSMHHNVT